MRIFTKLAAALAVAVPLMAATGTAQARDTSSFSITIGSGYQDARYGNNYGHNYNRRILPPNVVRAYIQRSYREVSRLDRRGDVYIARAEDRRGRDLRVTADVYTGRILDVQYTRRDHDRRDDRRDNRRHWR